MTETRIARIGDLPLESGATLPGTEIAYVSYGTLAPDGRNALLLTHGYTSSHLFADGEESAEGSWARLVGPGRAIDTDRFFVVASNMLGSSYGSSAPKSLNPATGKPYGPDFPRFTVDDIVEAQRRLLALLGVDHLAAVVGPSYGGFQAFTWAARYPDFVDAIVPAVSGLRAPRRTMDDVEARLATNPNWNGGHYYEKGGIGRTMTAIRAETLRAYGIEAELAPRIPDPVARAAAIEAKARAWSDAFDGHSLLALGRAASAYDVEPRLKRIRAKVLYVLSRTDSLFPPTLAPAVMTALRGAGVDARYHEIDSANGHLASGLDADAWAPVLGAFLDGGLDGDGRA